jgi:hypothetical protein
MTPRRPARPPVRGEYDQPFGEAPAMLDGMEVLFDRTVGLDPVELDGGPAREVRPDGRPS